MVRRCACFDPHETGLHSLEECKKSRTSKLLTDDHGSRRVNAMNLKDVLGDIQSDRDNLAHGRFSSSGLTTATLWHRGAGSGGRPLHQFKRANRSLRKLKTCLGRVIRDIRRKTSGHDDLREAFVRPLYLAERVLSQDRRQRGRKVYSLHAPEVECIGKGKAHKPYEFGVKVSVATTVKHSAGGQFVAHVAALPGNPYDGHTLATVIPQMQALLGNVLDRIITDAGYRGHNAPPEHKFKVYTAGQKRRVTEQIKREFKRRSAIEPVIGHLKDDHRMGRNYLAHSSGDAINAVLAAAGYNFRRLIAWLTLLLLRILSALSLDLQLKPA
jgi:IS5 family transposase